MIPDPGYRASVSSGGANTLPTFGATAESVELLHESGLSLTVDLLQRVNSLVGGDSRLRDEQIFIENSSHQPPPAHLVPNLLEDFVRYFNDFPITQKGGIHLSAYALWRINWIHPFLDGNGRTARALASAILVSHYGKVSVGPNPIEHLEHGPLRERYYAALEDADRSWKAGQLDLSSLEQLISTICIKAFSNQIGAPLDIGGDRLSSNSGRLLALSDQSYIRGLAILLTSLVVYYAASGLLQIPAISLSEGISHKLAVSMTLVPVVWGSTLLIRALVLRRRASDAAIETTAEQADRIKVSISPEILPGQSED